MASLLFVTNSLTGGGAERSTNLIANELFSRGHRVGVVPINSSPGDLVTLNCPTFEIKRNWQSGLIGTLLAMMRFLRVVRKFQADFIILNCDLPELFGLFVKSNAQIIIVEHSNKPWMNRSRIGHIVRKLYKSKDVIWLSVRDTLKIWPENSTPQHSINNPVLNPTSLTVAAIQEVDSLNRLIFLGRLSVEKGIEKFLEIAKETRESSLVIGDGPMREALARDYQNLSEISFLGQKKNPWQDLTRNDLLIVPSLHEGDGLVVIEALSTGIPILLSDIPEFRRFGLPEKNYCKDKEEFIAAIKEFKYDITLLVVPTEVSSPILSSRSIHSIADSWEIFLQKSTR